jgi:hypothetical protein
LHKTYKGVPSSPGIVMFALAEISRNAREPTNAKAASSEDGKDSDAANNRSIIKAETPH